MWKREGKGKAWGSDMSCPNSGIWFPACNPVPAQWITLLTKGQFVKEWAPTGKQQAGTCLLTSAPDLPCLGSVLHFTTQHNVQKPSQRSSGVATDSGAAMGDSFVCVRSGYVHRNSLGWQNIRNSYNYIWLMSFSKSSLKNSLRYYNDRHVALIKMMHIFRIQELQANSAESFFSYSKIRFYFCNLSVGLPEHTGLSLRFMVGYFWRTDGFSFWIEQIWKYLYFQVLCLLSYCDA